MLTEFLPYLANTKFLFPLNQYTFLFMVRNWWEYAKIDMHIQITFIEYIDTLTLAIILYIQATLLTPDIPKEAVLNLKNHYIKIAPLFFIIILFIFLKGQIIRLMTNYTEVFTLINFIRLIFIFCLFLMIFIKNRKFHIAMFIVSSILYSTYVLFAEKN